MKLLFIHPNFPGQYCYLAPALARDPANTVVAIADKASLVPGRDLGAIRLLAYDTPKGASPQTHPYLAPFETAVRRGQQVVRLCMELRSEGFVPDCICVHPGWGDALYLKEVYPESRVLAYFEFFNHARGTERDFDPEYPDNFNTMLAARTYNAINLMALSMCDWGVSPTQWQWAAQPPEYRNKISVIFDGVDTVTCSPRPSSSLLLDDGRRLGRGDTVITYVARGLEPFRGWHSFIRAVPLIQKQHPDAHVIVVGGEQACYMPPLPEGSYRDKHLAEVGKSIDGSRLHFMGKLAYDRYLQVLNASSAHVYLTYPAVLSWSLIEAMASGCAIVASRTAPVMEVIEDGVHGVLADFFSAQDIAAKVSMVLSQPALGQSLRDGARHAAIQRHDLSAVCLPRQIELVRRLALGQLP